jgi:regulator of replication initiation timing
VGDADAVREGTLQSAILDTIDQLGKIATLTQIAKFLERDKGNVKKEITELVNKNILVAMEKEGREIRYKRPDKTEPTPNSSRRDVDEYSHNNHNNHNHNYFHNHLHL